MSGMSSFPVSHDSLPAPIPGAMSMRAVPWNYRLVRDPTITYPPVGCDSSCFGFLAPDHGVPTNFLKDPIYYKYKCFDDSRVYLPLYRQPGYGFRSMVEPRKVIEGFDFAWNTTDYTPSYCMYSTSGRVKCYSP